MTARHSTALWLSGDHFPFQPYRITWIFPAVSSIFYVWSPLLTQVLTTMPRTRLHAFLPPHFIYCLHYRHSIFPFLCYVCRKHLLHYVISKKSFVILLTHAFYTFGKIMCFMLSGTIIIRSLQRIQSTVVECIGSMATSPLTWKAICIKLLHQLRNTSFMGLRQCLFKYVPILHKSNKLNEQRWSRTVVSHSIFLTATK
jgi:hypothetical protein